MVERRGRAEGFEIREVVEDVPPVAEEKKRGRYVGTHLREQLVVEHGTEGGYDYDDEHDGGHEPSNAPQPEILEVDGFRLSPFGYQQAGDQVAGKDEEYGDAKQSALGPREVHVVGDDRENRESA